MKPVIILILALLPLIQAFPQCSTEMPESMIEWLEQFQLSGMKQKRAGVEYVPVKFHLVAMDDGTGRFTVNHTINEMCNLNAKFLQAGIQFYIYNEINFINSSTLYYHSSGYQAVIQSHISPNVANVFVVQQDANNSQCGYYRGFEDYIAIIKSCTGNAQLAHLFGHYFSLPHTFYGWENRATSDPAIYTDERVNGSNCLTTGDRFCDTPADYISSRWTCPYNDTKTDYNGDLYQPDGSLIMSYSNDLCQTRFSNEQIVAMQSHLSGQRPYLLNHALPDTVPLIDAAYVFPQDYAVGIPANYVMLKWRKVPGASHYHLRATRFANMVIFNVDTLVTDTFIVLTNLQYPYNYRWMVRPVSEGNYCMAFPDHANFLTSAPIAFTPQANVSRVSCKGGNDGSISITTTGMHPPFDYQWSNGSDTSEIFDLPRGAYQVTITDNSGDSVVLLYDVTEPDEQLSVYLSLQSGILQASVTGGTPPYYYDWSDSSSQSSIPIANALSYYLTVTDSRGCVTSTVFNTPCDSIVIHGYLRQSTGDSLINSKIYLIRLDASDSSLHAIDSAFTDSTGYYQIITDEFAGLYIKAVPDSSDYPDEMPTYYDSSLVFQDATPIDFAYCDTYRVDFKTIHGVNPGGSGFIGGFVSEGAGKSGFFNNPVAGLQLLLINSANQPVGHARTDANGYFSFSNIPLDDYSVWVDKPGIDNSLSPMISIDVTQPVVDSAQFLLHSNFLEHVFPTGNTSPAGISPGITIYPNPSNRSVTFLFNHEIQQPCTLKLTDLHGKMVLQRENIVSGFVLERAGIPNGIYIAEISGEEIFRQKLILY